MINGTSEGKKQSTLCTVVNFYKTIQSHDNLITGISQIPYAHAFFTVTHFMHYMYDLTNKSTFFGRQPSGTVCIALK